MLLSDSIKNWYILVTMEKPHKKAEKFSLNYSLWWELFPSRFVYCLVQIVLFEDKLKY